MNLRKPPTGAKQEFGPIPFPGGHWQHAACWAAKDDLEAAADSLVRFVLSSNPGNCRLVVMKGEWLDQNPAESATACTPRLIGLFDPISTPGPLVGAAIFCTFAWEPLTEGGESERIGKDAERAVSG